MGCARSCSTKTTRFGSLAIAAWSLAALANCSTSGGELADARTSFIDAAPSIDAPSIADSTTSDATVGHPADAAASGNDAPASNPDATTTGSIDATATPDAAIAPADAAPPDAASDQISGIVYGRYEQGMTYDIARDRVVMFSGGELEATNQDVAEWDGTTWVEITPTPSPTGRGAMNSMVYDEQLQLSILFGSEDDTATNRNDTWGWDGTTWTQFVTAHAPTPRTGFTMSYDSDRKIVVLFSGIDAGGRVQDTWEFDGTDWTQRLPVHQPDARNVAAMAYDSASHQTILFGGFTDTQGLMSDTWAWDGSDWTELTPADAPPARNFMVMADDPGRSQLLLYGGTTNFASYLSDTWTWDGTNWTEQFPDNSPGVRLVNGLASDSKRDRVVLFGGQTAAGSTPLADTWTWDGTTWTEH